MHFLRVNVTLYDVVNMIHDVIRGVYPFPYTAKFMFVCVKNNKTEQMTLKGSKIINSLNPVRCFVMRPDYVCILYKSTSVHLQSAQAKMGRKFLISTNFRHVLGPFYTLVQFVL